MQGFQDAFISYGRADSKAFAAQLHHHLVEQGLTVWFDFDDIPLGVDYQKQIDDGINRADNFLFIISPHSVNSPYCRLEIELALKRNKRIIPLMHVAEISRETWQQRNPTGTDADWETYQAKGLHSSFINMHPEISKINWVYFRENQDDFQESLKGLLTIFDRHHDYVHQHTQFLAKALEWEENQRRSQYLLVGEDRQHAETWLKTRFTDSQPPCTPTELHCEFITESIKNGENLMTQVFLSYATEDRDIAKKIRSSLLREAFTVWINTTDIQTGVDFENAIKRGIEEANNIVYLLSPRSLTSYYCQLEIDYALSLNKRIVPILVEAIDPQQLPPTLRNLQYIDLTDNLLETDYQHDENQLLRALRQDVAYHEDHKVLLTKAFKWERHNYNPTFLLRGYNLRHAEAWLKLAKHHPRSPSTPLQEKFIAESQRQPPGIAVDVFISYSRADSGFARQLNEALQMQGKNTWFDQESIASGTDFQQEIYRGIETANHFLFILSPSSINSPYCADEVEYAAKLNKRFVTVLHRPINPANLHPELAKVQWLDFNGRDGDFSSNFKDLLRVLDTDAAHLKAHTWLLVRAIEWDNKGRSDSLLLRGDDLSEAEQWLDKSNTKQPEPTELHQNYIRKSREVEAANQRLAQAGARAQQIVRVGWVVLGATVVVGATVWVGARLVAQKMVDSAVELWLKSTVPAISREIGTLFSQVGSTQQIIQKAFTDDLVDLNNKEELEIFYMTLAKAHPNLNWIQFGFANGDYFGLQHTQEGNINIINRDYDPQAQRATRTVESYRRVDDTFEFVETLSTPENYYSPQRPWYRSAVGNPGYQTWTDVYMFASTQTPGIDSSVTVQKQNQLLGVISIAIELRQLSVLLERLQQGQPGALFIITPKGELIASSDPRDLGFTSTERDIPDLVTLDEVENPLAQYASQVFRKNQVSLEHIKAQQIFKHEDSESEVKYRVAINPIRNLDWNLVVVMPESVLTEEFDSYNRITTIAIVLLVLLMVTAVFLLSRQKPKSTDNKSLGVASDKMIG
ncbi:TIR domain-containing protein [Oscillatoria sp. FACHB-1407]|uniref:TIR domain-containing protein n=1 Tax=Oscillatoria sp. FACHB-1407 TaxID=2692847 RepID=UPI001682ADFC|nr:TIR domain-containing protein [Oscillatoria sp. FACHB-1407]MBD2461864.1 TIR domain-containing protein [Oscillatoria sp. FACHB-1407]